MVSKIRIYVEGGGDGKDTKSIIRHGFSMFLGPLVDKARERLIQWTIIACGPREAAFDNFKMALRSHPQAFNVLLVDAEGPVKETPWQHLKVRDSWATPPIQDECCHLMVQMMEAWFVADIEALQAFYGQGFIRNAIPDNPNVEEIDKELLKSSLDHATQNTLKGRYHKIRHAAKLLQKVNPREVRAKAPYCDRLFNTLTKEMETSI